jgi:hypothetical protein
MDEIDNDWESFCDDEYDNTNNFKKQYKRLPVTFNTNNPISIAPKSNILYISTQTIISFLNTSIDLKDVFWKLPIIPYSMPTEGIIKKQMKFNSQTQSELDCILSQKKTYDYVDEYIINHIDNPTGRIKFKDVRKISIGISKKDIMSYRCKKKSAFYNCFVIIMRLLHNDIYKEIHVKVFNTGKLEIPGIQNDDVLNKVYILLIKMLTPFITNTLKLSFIMEKSQTVLINSNFNCGYYLKRDVLNDLFKKKYNDTIRSSYDPCTYPGIQCEIYYKQELDKNGKSNVMTITDMKTTTDNIKVSFMVFRTGSVLIVGKCSKDILNDIYQFLCGIFISEYNIIHEANVINKVNILKQKRNSKVKHIIVNV